MEETKHEHNTSDKAFDYVSNYRDVFHYLLPADAMFLHEDESAA